MKYVQKWIWQVIQLVGFLALLGTNYFGMFAQADMVYVANYDSNIVSVIDTGNNNTVTTIPVGGQPSNIVVNSTGTLAYIFNDNQTISVINTVANAVIFVMSVSLVPVDIVVNPMGTLAYVSSYNHVDVINIASNSVVATVPVGLNPRRLVITPNGKYVYVANYDSGDVSVINTSTNKVIATIAIPTPNGNPQVDEMIVNSAGTFVYVTNYPYNINVINTEINKVVATIPIGGPGDMAINSSETRLYVTNGYDNTISVIDTNTNSIIDTVTVGSRPASVAVNPSGTRVYVSSYYDDIVSVIDTSNNGVIATVKGGGFDVLVNRSGTRVYVSNGNTGTINLIDTSTNTVIDTIVVGENILDIAVIDKTTNQNNVSICNSVTEIPVSECQSLLLSGNSIKATGVFAGTDTKFYGGVSKDRTNYLSYLMATPSSKMTLKLGIITEPADIGKQADLLWVVGVENNTPFDGGVDTTYFVMDEMGSLSTVDLYNQPTVWMNQLAEKPFKRNVTLQKETVIDEINLGYPSVYPSVNYYFIGYRLSDGTLVYSQTPIISKIE